MNWLPTPPTDNLHKYIALNGLWFIYGVLALLTVLHYQNFEHEEFNKRQSSLFSKQDAVRKFESRINSLANGKLTENNIPGISSHFNPKEEKVFLENAIVLNQQDISSLSEETKKPPTSWFSLLVHFHVDKFLVVFLGVGLVLTYCGFRSWAKSQRVVDEIQRHDLALKRFHLKEANSSRFKRGIPAHRNR
jgi:hypothetical protein